MDNVQRSDGRWVSVGDIVASPSFNGRGIIKRIDRTPHGIQVTVSFKQPVGSSQPGVALNENREHAFNPNELVAQRGRQREDILRQALRRQRDTGHPLDGSWLTTEELEFLLELGRKASGRQQDTRPTAHPGAADAGIRITRLLGEAIGAAQLITAGGDGEYGKPRLLTEIASMVASPDPARAARLLGDAERVARSSAAVWGSQPVIDVAKAVVATDPDRALRLARSITNESGRAHALADIARALAAADPDRAARVFDDAERLAQSMTDENPKARALAAIARALAATDPDRAARLLDDAERLARSMAIQPPSALAKAMAATDPDRALRLARSILMDGLLKVRALVVIARALATTDPDRGVRLLDDAERVARSITDNPYLRAQALVDIAKAWAEW